MLFVPPASLDEELLPGDGLWSRGQLEEMNDRFVAAVEAVFQSGLESRSAAAATVRIGRNGSRRLEVAAAIGAAWNYLRHNMDAGVDVSAVEVMARVRASCPGVSVEEVREEFWRRLKEGRQSIAV